MKGLWTNVSNDRYTGEGVERTKVLVRGSEAWPGVFVVQYEARKTGTEIKGERFLPYCMPLYKEEGQI